MTTVNAANVYTERFPGGQHVPVNLALPGVLYSGVKTVTTPGTEVALAASQALLSGVTLKATATNTGAIFVGPNGVSSATGFPLLAGEILFVETSNLANVYIDAEVGGEGVAYLGV